MKKRILLILLTLIMALNYYKTFDVDSTDFDNFRATSQILAEFSIFAGSYKMEKTAYGLGKIEYPGETTSDGLDLTWIKNEGIDTSTLTFRPYKSQMGLQGSVYYYISEIIPLSYETIISLMMKICALLMSIVAIAIVILLKNKMGSLMSFCFYMVFMLSPWVCIYGRDLYWVEFTWFLPLLVGIIFSMGKKEKYHVLCYIGAFLTVLVKSLCGYEFISTIMMSLLLFPVMECLTVDRNQKLKYFKKLVILGLCALIGFAMALLLHGYFRGDGNIVTGVKEIYYGDILRRTVGTNIEDAQIGIFSILQMYFRFPTQIVTGVDGNIFPYMVLTVVAILIYKRFILKNAEIKIEILTVFSFLTTISWYVLAKDHSFNHPHMNYVLWYFGFIQICFYVVIDFIQWVLIKNCKELRKVK